MKGRRGKRGGRNSAVQSSLSGSPALPGVCSGIIEKQLTIDNWVRAGCIDEEDGGGALAPSSSYPLFAPAICCNKPSESISCALCVFVCAWEGAERGVLVGKSV